LLAATLLLAFGAAGEAHAQGTSFIYQGRLQDGGVNANGNYDFQFTLWDALTGGTQQPQPSPVTVTRTGVAVANGVFTLELDFGASAFPGANRWLETSARPAGSAFTMLSPRQQISGTPYAIRSASAASADTATSATNAVTATNTTQLGGIAANQYVLTSDTRLSNARPPTAGSLFYIQSSPSSTQTASFHISGNGSAGGALSGNIVDATTQYNLNGQKVLSAFGGGNGTNISVGVSAGGSTTGNYNSFFGTAAGRINAEGFQNSFFGANAGFSNTSGFQNAFFGTGAGSSNTTAGNNAFFGDSTGASNTIGDLNSFFGRSAGFNNLNGVQNAFFGFSSGSKNTSGAGNVAVGAFAGQSNTTEGQNTYIGYVADGAAAITNATAIGASAKVTQSNSLVLGSIANVNGADSSAKVGIGTTAPVATLDVRGDSLISGNVGIGTLAPSARLDVANGNIAINNNLLQLRGASDANHGMLYSGVVDGPEFRAFGGFRWTNGAGGASERMRLDLNGNLGIGTPTPQAKLHVNGVIRLDVLGQPVGNSPLCLNGSNQIAFCNISSLRYKTNVEPFAGGLSVIERLRPISFDWKEGGGHDVGLAAEEVNRVAPLFAFRNNKGEIEGVKYNQLSAVFINAFKEQQAQIRQQQEQLKQQQELIKQQQDQTKQQRETLAAQQQQLDALKTLVCHSHRRARVCR
jgi:Chaperone of endosialidase